jgi:RNA polymerase sigma-70 factor, ECF subfamily
MSQIDDDPPETDLDRAIEPLRQDLTIYCYLMLGSMEEARDAVTATCQKARRHYSAVPDPTTLRLWLYRTATDVSFDNDVLADG